MGDKGGKGLDFIIRERMAVEGGGWGGERERGERWGGYKNDFFLKKLKILRTN